MDSHVPHVHSEGSALRRAVRLVAMLNLGYFGVEFVVASAVPSMMCCTAVPPITG